jgi:hypothetical protein
LCNAPRCHDECWQSLGARKLHCESVAFSHAIVCSQLISVVQAIAITYQTQKKAEKSGSPLQPSAPKEMDTKAIRKMVLQQIKKKEFVDAQRERKRLGRRWRGHAEASKEDLDLNNVNDM